MTQRRALLVPLLVGGIGASVFLAWAQPWAPAPAGTAGERSPSRDAAIAFFAQRDQEMTNGSWDRLLAAFDSQRQPVFRDALQRRVADLQKLGNLRARSQVLDYFRRGAVGVAILRTELHTDMGRRDLVTYTALGGQGADLRALFAVEAHPFAAQLGVGKSDAFRCAACNYEVRFGAGWLAVPRCPTRSHCMEAWWLVSLTDDLHIDFAVHVGETAVPAEQALRNCLDTTRGRDWIATDSPPQFAAWRPGGVLPPGATSVRCTTRCKGALVAEMNMLAIGRLRYLIVVRGWPATLDSAQRRADVDAILDSFTVLDPEITARQLALNATHVHSGRGEMRGHVYHNPRARVEVAGPQGWQQTVRAGDCMFSVEFAKPGDPDSSLGVKAMGSVGGPWTRARVESVINTRIARLQELDPKLAVDVDFDSWESRNGLEALELQLCDGAFATYAFRTDLLLILNGMVRDAKDTEALRQAMRSARSLPD